MSTLVDVTRKISCLSVALFCLLPATVMAQEETAATVLFKSVRVFDGQELLEPVDVLIKDGRIEAIGEGITVRNGAEEIDGAGKTLLPGLIDCHVHAYFPAHLEQAAVFGVTTVLDMMSMPRGAAGLRAARTSGKHPQRADYFSAGAAVTVKDGHGTQFGFTVPVLEDAAGADAFITERVREGSDYIKIIYDTGNSFGLDKPTLTPEMLKAAIEAAQANEKLAVAHIGDAAGAELAVEYGIEGLVHLFADDRISDELVQRMAEEKIFVVPTTVVIQNITGPVTVATLINDDHIGPMLLDADRSGLARTFPKRDAAVNT
ncbi:MAG: amidohydrolase family protein, partial [Pirellulaceae bacterium]